MVAGYVRPWIWEFENRYLKDYRTNAAQSVTCADEEQ
jgi:hypothetical protein